MGISPAEVARLFIAKRSPVDREIIGGFFASRLARGVRPDTVRFYSFAFSWLPSPIPDSPTGLELAMAAAQEKLSPASCQSLWRGWRALYSWAHRRYGISNVPTLVDPPVRRPHSPRVFTKSEMVAANDAALSLRDKTFVAVALCTFARRGELASMRWRDVDGDFVYLRSTKGRIHWAPLDGRAKSLLAALREQDSPSPDDHVWRSSKGTPLTLWSVSELWRRIARRAGLSGRRRGLHTIRHTAITAYLDKSGDIERARQIAGHTSIKTTEIYVHLTRQQLLRGFEEFSPGRMVDEGGSQCS